MTAPTVDVVDTLTGAAPDGVVTAVRSIRPVTREQLQASYDALFDPVDDSGFGVTERLLVAAFATRLTGADATADHYAQRAAAADAAAASVIASLADEAGTSGPFGRYREEGLAGESADGLRFSVPEGARAQLGDRLAAALEHAHLLVYRPREAADAALRHLLDAGWTVSGIVTLSQLVAFLAFQQRVVAGLRVLEEVGA